MIWQIKKTSHFWTEEKSLTSMFILLCVGNFVVFPFFSELKLISFIVRITWLALLFGGISNLSWENPRIRILYSIPLSLIVINIIRYISGNQILTIADFITDVAVYSLFMGMVLVKVFEAGPVTAHRVVGAIVVFMLTGNLWAIIYQFIYGYVPGSFQFPASYADHGADPAAFLYFSYTTLTTTGYGEIVPSHALTRSLANIEQLIGVLYPAVLIGRLVSLVVTKR
jgi:voltage-gated potassium channel Kch